MQLWRWQRPSNAWLIAREFLVRNNSVEASQKLLHLFVANVSNKH
jgi:hypothetical protein